MANTSRISKLLSLMLRHRPDEFGLEIDAYGYAPLDQVVQGVQERYAEVAEADIVSLVKARGQYRFELNEFGIRALYGHSFFVDMDGEPMDPPPDQLYMGTTRSAAQRFTREGISPGDRYYVHLSLTREAAESHSHQRDTPCGPRGRLSIFCPRHGRADRRNSSQLHRPHPR
ncbi:MAG: RNA 2'-phosphotransferase [Candidatus Latescibacteria bacterium]|nr:RNA 2'-phosphotransferase [Candidatus Latescibacterota bacterium]